MIHNPFAGQYAEDLSRLFDLGRELGERLMPDLAKLLGGQALVHPELGKPMRAAIGGGTAVICSNVEVAPAASAIDMPLANKDNIWSFDDFSTLTISVPDAPRVGKGPITT